MRKGLGPGDLDGLLERPLLAVLATHRADGDMLLSPVWHRWREGGFDVVTGADDVKARHLRRDPRASIVVCEHEPPYRGIEVRGRVVLDRAGPEVVRDIAVRYLGPEKGQAYVEQGYDDTLIRLEPGQLRAWDFTDDAEL
jgi:PPOX class probable F420-dependent enzyme